MPADHPEVDETDAAGEIRSLVVAAEAGGVRLDRYLSQTLPDLTRVHLQNLIRAGHVSRDGIPVAVASTKVKPGETYQIAIPPPEPAEPEGEAMPLTIVFEDDDLIVIDKPAGLVVHPAAGHQGGTLVNALIAHCGTSLSGIGGVRRPGIVHRLDKDTSGLLVVAKSDRAHQGLSAQFASHGADGRLHREYRAFVWGVPARPAGVVDARLDRSSTNRTKITVVKGEAGRHAVTHYAVEATYQDTSGRPAVSQLRLALETGRTHQIRVHMAHAGHPVLADPIYGAGFKASARTLSPEAQSALEHLGRQALHAASLGFEHPVTGRLMAFESPLPPDMARLETALAPLARATANKNKDR